MLNINKDTFPLFALGTLPCLPSRDHYCEAHMSPAMWPERSPLEGQAAPLGEDGSDGGNGGLCFPRKEAGRGAGAAADPDSHRTAPSRRLPTGFACSLKKSRSPRKWQPGMTRFHLSDCRSPLPSPSQRLPPLAEPAVPFPDPSPPASSSHAGQRPRAARPLQPGARVPERKGVFDAPQAA